MDLGKARLQFQCAAIAGDRFVQFPLLLQSIAQVVLGFREVRIQLQCAAVTGYRFGNPVQGAICFPQVVVEGSRMPLQGDRASNVIDGGLVLARLGSEHAEKMERVGMIRRDGENLPIDLLGSLQPAGLVVLDRDRKASEMVAMKPIMAT